MTTKTINYRSSNDWGCEHTEEDAERWRAFLARRLAEIYGATVTVETSDGDSEAEVAGLDVEACEVIQVVGCDLWDEFCALNWCAEEEKEGAAVVVVDSSAWLEFWSSEDES